MDGFPLTIGLAGRTAVVLAALVIIGGGCRPKPTVPAADPSKASTSPTVPTEVTPAEMTTDLSTDKQTEAPTATSEVGVAPERDTGRVADDADGAVEIVFEDIQLPIQADMVFRPFMLTDRVKELDGRRIRIHGVMLPDSKTKGIRQFVLLKNIECKFGPGGQADHLINVLMVEGVTATYRDDPVAIEGILKINPFEGPDGNTWSIYDLACDRVERYRPRR